MLNNSRGRYSNSPRELKENQEYEYENLRKQGKKAGLSPSLIKFIVFGGIVASLILAA